MCAERDTAAAQSNHRDSGVGGSFIHEENNDVGSLQSSIAAPPLPEDILARDLPPISDALAFALNVSRNVTTNPHFALLLQPTHTSLCCCTIQIIYFPY